MERLRDTPASPRTVQQMSDMLMATPPERYLPRLRKYAREMLDAGYDNAQLYNDLRHLYWNVSGRGNEELEEAILDVMDFLTGWCAPGARLY